MTTGLTDQDFELIVGREANRLIEDTGGFYVQEIRDKVIGSMPADAQRVIYDHPLFTQMLLDGIHARIYAWLRQFERIGRFRTDRLIARHPAFGCLPDGKGNYLWFRVADVGPDVLDKWIASRQRKIARLEANLQPLLEVRRRLRPDQHVSEIIDYE